MKKLLALFLHSILYVSLEIAILHSFSHLQMFDFPFLFPLVRLS